MVDLYRLRGPSTYNISTREPVPTYMLIAAAEPEARSEVVVVVVINLAATVWVMIKTTIPAPTCAMR